MARLASLDHLDGNKVTKAKCLERKVRDEVLLANERSERDTIRSK